jgi:hypothetical protein
LLQDDCGILGSPPQLPAGALHISGDTVSLDYEMFGIQLRGQFREDGEGFYLDGTAPNVSTMVGSEACNVDLVQVHIDATSESASTFAGSLGIRYDEVTRERCRCETHVQFRAERVPSAPP